MGSIEDRPDSIPARIHESFCTAVEREQIHVYEATGTEVAEDPAGVKHLLHICPEISSKPPPRSTTPPITEKPKKDIFAGDWAPGEHIMDFEGYPLISNLYALASEHIVAVTPLPFRSQSSGLLAQDIYVAHQIVQAYVAEGRETLCFFNGGPLSGASQPHLHIQFFPFQAIAPAPEALARSLPHQPIPALLPLPYLHLYVSLPPLPTSASPEDIKAILFATFNALLSTSETLLSKLPESELPPKGYKRGSYNFYLTGKHMHFVPRTERMAEITRVESVGQRGEDVTITMSINGLCFAGYWHVGTPEEISDLKSFGITRILKDCGYRRELWSDEVLQNLV